MQGSQLKMSNASLKSESVWFKTKLISQFLTLSFILTQPFYLSYLHAAPVGGNVVGGTGSISQADLTTTINQTSQNLAINWDSFDIKANERVNFVQPNTSSIALNRILGNKGSTIHGQINANGHVILINPHGIFFTSTATINVGGIIASSLDMTSSDFMNGHYIFNEVLGTDGAVVNSGIINASLGGNVALIGKQVKNDGLISAKLGSVVLAAGKQSVLTFDNQGLIGVKVTKEILQEELGLEEAVINSGEINTAGGRVLLTASTSQDVFSQAVNTNSLDQATSVVVHDDGTFTLGGGADVLNTGSIDVSSELNTDNTTRIILLGENITSSGSIKADVKNGKAGEIEIHAKNKTLLTKNSITSAKALSSGQGGLIKILGDKVGLLDNTLVDASGVNGGGEILIGGDQEGRNSLIRNAQFIYLSDQSQVKADATDNGDGGKVITFAENSAKIHGKLFARGGINGGNGGFIETSGLLGFQITSVPDASSFVGNNGTWLIDPFNITITGNTQNVDDDSGNFSFFDAIQSGAEIDVDDIKKGLENGDVIIRTTRTDGNTPVGTENGNIDIIANIDFDGIKNENATLTLDADSNITLDTAIRIYDKSNPGEGDQLNLNLFARGDILLKTGSSITTHGGHVTIGDVVNSIIPANFTNNGIVNTTGGTNQNGGNIKITVSIADPLQGKITSTGSLITTGGVANRGGGNNPGINGFKAGTISLNSTGDINISGNIESLGSQGDYRANDNTGRDGGIGGDVTITSSKGDIDISGSIKTIGGLADGDNTDTGGAADPGNGGNGGFINIESTTGTVSVGVLETNGGNAIGADDFPGDTGVFAKGGNAGKITLTSGTGITLNNTITANGGAKGAHNNSLVGDGGLIQFNGDVTLATNIIVNTTGNTNGDIEFNGTVSAVGDRNEDLSVTGKDITFAGNVGSLNNRFKDIIITSNGIVKAETGPTVAERTDFFVDTLNVNQSSTFSARHINAIAVDDTSTSTVINNNTVIINSGSSIDVGNISTTAGGNATGAGLSGGGILLTAQDITVGTLSSSGSDAGVIDVNGGDAGVITLAATDNASNGTPSITLNGDLNSEGGAAVGGTGVAGTSQNVKLSINSTQSNAVGTVTVGAFTGDFSSAVDVTGSNGTDTLVASDRTNDWVLTGPATATLNSQLTFTDFEEITGSGALNSDTLTARSVNNTWLVNGSGSGSVTNTDDSNESMVFRNINNLVGNAGVDDFTLTSTGSVTGSIDGGSSANNSLTIETGFDNVWTINSANAGTVSLTTKLGNGFSNIQKIKGGDGDDTFNFGINGSVDLVEGGADNSNAPTPTQGDIVNFTSKTAGVDVTLGTTLTASTTDFNIDSVEQINANATAAKNTLTAKDQDNTWNITKADGGTLDSGTDNTLDFNNFTDLNGALNFDDQFIIGLNGSLTGQLDGRGQNTPTGDQLDLSLRADIVLNIDNTLGNSLSFSGGDINYADIETIVGNGTTSTVTGDDIDTTWTITGTNSGSLKQTAIGGTRTTFSGFNNLTGGTGIDRFNFDAAGDITGFVDGGTAVTNDFVSMTTATALSKAFSLSSTLNSNATNIINIENVQGDSTTTGFVELIGADTTGTNTWTITGIDRGTVQNSVDGKIVTITDVKNITGGNGNDNFDFVGATTSIQITGLIDGGSGGTDIVDMSGLTGSISVDIGNDITRIDSVKGNNNATLIGADFTSNWNIRGINSGDIAYNDGMSNLLVGFSQFNNLEGKDGINDSFKFFVGGDITGVIKGGGAGGVNSIDTADYSLIQNKTIIVGDPLQGIIEIEQVTGDNSTTVLRGISSFSNTWLLDATVGDGLNDGQVSFTDASNVIHDLLFLNISKLEAGASNDNFTIRDGAFLNGSIKGGLGNDQINIQLTGTQSGLLSFDGSLGGTNTLNITGDSDNGGGDADYNGVYTSNVDQLNSDQFVYTNGLNAYTIKYSDAATVNDNLIAGSLTVEGTSGRDKITLGTNTFQVSTNFGLLSQNDAGTVNYSNKTNFIVDGLANNTDIIDTSGPITLGGTLSLQNGTITTAGAVFPLITANELFLDSISNTGTSSGKKLNTDVSHLSVINSGSLFVENQSGINIAELNNTNAAAQLNIVALTGNITAVDRNIPTTDADLISNGALSLDTIAGSITLNGNNQLSGKLNLSTATAGDVRIRNTTATILDTVTTRDLTVITSGLNSNISQFNNQSAVMSTGLTRLSSSGNINLANASNDFTTLTVDTAQAVTIRDANTIGLNSVNATSVDITVVDDISDANGNAPGDNVSASFLKLRAGTGIGNSNALEIRVSDIDAVTTTGQINIDNVRNVKLTNLVVTNGGNITFNNTGDVEIVKVDAGFGTRSPLAAGGDFNMTVTSGSVIGSPRANYRSVPDITAFNANILVPSGTFGNAGRPISVNVNNEFNLFSLQSAVAYIGQPLVKNDTSTAKIAITDAFTSLAGQQLIEIESIGDIDPAIFTDVRNYNHSDIALMMPSDQRYDISDEEEEDEKAKLKREKFLKSN